MAGLGIHPVRLFYSRESCYNKKDLPNCMRNLSVIEYLEAKKIVDMIVDLAAQQKKAVVAAVADPHGELIAFARMDGAPLSSINVAINKAYTAARERKPTKDIGEKVRHP